MGGLFEADLMKENLKEVSCRQPIPYLVQVRANLHRKKDVSSGGTTTEHNRTKNQEGNFEILKYNKVHETEVIYYLIR